jgi:hypothetical protein
VDNILRSLRAVPQHFRVFFQKNPQPQHGKWSKNTTATYCLLLFFALQHPSDKFNQSKKRLAGAGFRPLCFIQRSDDRYDKGGCNERGRTQESTVQPEVQRACSQEDKPGLAAQHRNAGHLLWLHSDSGIFTINAGCTARPGMTMTVGIPVGILIILSAFVLTGLYVRKANGEFDQLNREIVEEAQQ